jgi:hypothetical protein
VTPAWFLAQVQRPPLDDPFLNSVRQTLNTGPEITDFLFIAAGVVGLIVVLALAARFFNQDGKTRAKPPPDYLAQAAELLGLSDTERHDVQRIAAEAKIEQPVAVLLSSTTFSCAAVPLLESSSDNELPARLDRLCRKLFDVPLESPPTG